MLLFLLVFAMRIRLLFFVPTRSTRTCPCQDRWSFFGSSGFFGSEESVWSEITNPFLDSPKKKNAPYFLLRFSQFFFCSHVNSEVQKSPSQLRFSLPSVIIAITSNELWNAETHKTDRNPLITDQSQTAEVKFCFLKGPLRWLTARKNANVSWLLWQPSEVVFRRI